MHIKNEMISFLMMLKTDRKEEQMSEKIVSTLMGLFPYGTMEKQECVFQMLAGFYRLAVEFEAGFVRVYYGRVDSIEIDEKGEVIRFNFKAIFGGDNESALSIDLVWAERKQRFYYGKNAFVNIKSSKFNVFSADGKEFL